MTDGPFGGFDVASTIHPYKPHDSLDSGRNCRSRHTSSLAWILDEEVEAEFLPNLFEGIVRSKIAQCLSALPFDT